MPPEFDVLIRNGTIYDGLGHPPVVGHVALAGDTIVAVGALRAARGRIELDAAAQTGAAFILTFPTA